MLSRTPVEPSDVNDHNQELESQAFVNNIVESLPASEQQLQRIKQSQLRTRSGMQTNSSVLPDKMAQ